MRRGSALLIVLGMISFLVASAVAFSAYMRLSRLPSSYLLRTSSSRSLVKAALAEALDEIERAIDNNPHPGVGSASSRDSLRNQVENRNTWRDRVLYGYKQGQPKSAPTEDTVATLTLEGLAYVPAPLVNDVRYHSRRTPTATWQDLDFDVGRFAFTAVDVSDYLDVNRVMAAPEGGGRTSAANARVTLAYLFEDVAHSSWRIQPDKWDQFMDAYLDEDPMAGTKVPLVSWADLNLGIWDQKPAGVTSPWCRFVENGTEFVQDNEADRFALSNMVFATDSYYPREKTDETVLDLSNGANQPFSGLEIRDKTSYKGRGIDRLAQNNNKFMTKFVNNISLPELVQLCDYLDVDSVPTSLALPTTERVPMLTGVSIVGSGLQMVSSKKTKSLEKKDPAGNVTDRLTINYYTLSLIGELHPMVSAVYPFKHARGAEDADTFSAQVAATVTLVKKGSETSLRCAAAKNPATFTWENGQRNEAAGYGGDYKSVWAIRSSLLPLNVKRSPSDDDDCLIGPVDPQLPQFKFEMTSTLEASKLVSQLGLQEDAEMLKCTFRVVRHDRLDPSSGSVTATHDEETNGFLPSNAELSGTVETAPAKVSDSDEFVPVIQLGVRIVNQSGDTVDMMPACVEDDARPSQLVKDDRLRSAFARPFLRFFDKTQATTVSFSKSWFEASSSKPVPLAPEAYVADDPRFNHAPEDLVAVEKLDSEIQKHWLDHNTSGASGKDGDIYMATSDAGYLQSKFELSFLLDITGLFGNDMWGALNNGGYDGAARTAFGQSPAAAAMWRTYSQYKVGGRAGDNIDKLEITSGDGGAKICPFTPDTAVMMGALANTPRDWWAASTNDVGTVKQQMLENIDEALKYTFSGHSESEASRVTYKSMESLARTFIERFRTSTTADGWRNIYDGLDWDGADEASDVFKKLEDANPSVTFDSVDRKYLFGFWRECFAARQQLFLVFVRAEPTMMGAGAGGTTPPALGARAVALVWREPAAAKIDAPHRMRLLFYRQLD